MAKYFKPLFVFVWGAYTSSLQGAYSLSQFSQSNYLKVSKKFKIYMYLSKEKFLVI